MKPADLLINTPRQPRARKTLNRLLDAAQDILIEDGFEALSSNSVVERLGMSPPTFYRYFKNKHDLLRMLCQGLMEAQNSILTGAEFAERFEHESFEALATFTLDETIRATRTFKSGQVLLVLLRAIPELQPIRLKSHEEMAKIIAARLRSRQPDLKRSLLHARARLVIELGYSVVELLFETRFRNREVVIRRASAAIAAVNADLFED